MREHLLVESEKKPSRNGLFGQGAACGFLDRRVPLGCKVSQNTSNAFSIVVRESDLYPPETPNLFQAANVQKCPMGHSTPVWRTKNGTIWLWLKKPVPKWVALVSGQNLRFAPPV